MKGWVGSRDVRWRNFNIRCCGGEVGHGIFLFGEHDVGNNKSEILLMQ